jgi:hypothetical protein
MHYTLIFIYILLIYNVRIHYISTVVYLQLYLPFSSHFQLHTLQHIHLYADLNLLLHTSTLLILKKNINTLSLATTSVFNFIDCLIVAPFAMVTYCYAYHLNNKEELWTFFPQLSQSQF